MKFTLVLVLVILALCSGLSLRNGALEPGEDSAAASGGKGIDKAAEEGEAAQAEEEAAAENGETTEGEGMVEGSPAAQTPGDIQPIYHPIHNTDVADDVGLPSIPLTLPYGTSIDLPPPGKAPPAAVIENLKEEAETVAGDPEAEELVKEEERAAEEEGGEEEAQKEDAEGAHEGLTNEELATEESKKEEIIEEEKEEVAKVKHQEATEEAGEMVDDGALDSPLDDVTDPLVAPEAAHPENAALDAAAAGEIPESAVEGNTNVSGEDSSEDDGGEEDGYAKEGEALESEIKDAVGELAADPEVVEE